ITPRYFAGFVVTVREAGDRIRSQAHDRVLVVAPVHPANTIAFDVTLLIPRPFEMTCRALFFREHPLRRRWNREHSRRWAALRSPRVHRLDAIGEDGKAVRLAALIELLAVEVAFVNRLA